MSFEKILGILMSRIWLIILLTFITVSTTFFITERLPKVYTASSTVLIDYRRPLEGEISGELLPAGLADSYMTTQVGIIGSRPVAIRVVKMLGLDENPRWIEAFSEIDDSASSFDDWAINTLLENVDVMPRKNSRLVDIWYSSEDPAFAAETANAFAESYQEMSRDLLSNPAHTTKDSIEQTLENLKRKLEESQTNLSSFQKRTGILATEEQLDIETSRLRELNQQVLDAEVVARTAKGKESIIDSTIASGRSLESIPEVLSNQTIQRLKSELAASESELAEIATRYGERHASRINAAAQVKSLRTALQREMVNLVQSIRNEAKSAADQLNDVKREEDKQRKLVLELKGTRDALPSLLQEVETASANYNDALSAYSKYDMQISMSQTNVKVISSAHQPSSPIKPVLYINIALALIMGGLLGVVAAFLLEFSSPKIRTVKDIEGSDGLPFPREIPKAQV